MCSYAFLAALASARLALRAAMTLSTSPRCASTAETPMCLPESQPREQKAPRPITSKINGNGGGGGEKDAPNAEVLDCKHVTSQICDRARHPRAGCTHACGPCGGRPRRRRPSSRAAGGGPPRRCPRGTRARSSRSRPPRRSRAAASGPAPPRPPSSAGSPRGAAGTAPRATAPAS